MFEHLYRLRTLRLSDNNLICDCHLAWLARWLRRVPRLGLYTRCFSPNQLKGQNVADLHDQEFKCSGKNLTTTTVVQGGAEPTDTFQMVIDNILKEGKISETVYKYVQVCYLLPTDYKLILM